MIDIRGYVVNNMWWWKEAEKLSLELPKTGSIRLNISSVSTDKKVSNNCDYSKGKFISQVPTLEIIYTIGDSLIQKLKIGDLVELSICKNGIYYKEKHFTEIKELYDEKSKSSIGQIKLYHLKTNEYNVNNITFLQSLSTKHPKKVTKSTEEIVNMLSTLELPSVELPSLNLTQPTPSVKQLELA